MKNNINKVENLKNEIFYNKDIRYHYLIIKLINNGKIDKLINRITDESAEVKITSLHKKKYLNCNEQFLSLLSNYIYRFKEDFYFLNNNFDCILETLLQNEKYSEFLLCKRDVGDNQYLDYFSYNTKRLIVSGFYNNIKVLSTKSTIIHDFVVNNRINLKKDLLSSEETLNPIYNALVNLSLCNAKTLNNILLFEDINNYIDNVYGIYNENSEKAKLLICEYYINEWENMIFNYYERFEKIKILLK